MSLESNTTRRDEIGRTSWEGFKVIVIDIGHGEYLLPCLTWVDTYYIPCPSSSPSSIHIDEKERKPQYA